MKKRIGIFDSGIGGMTLLHQALLSLPNEKFIYYADTDNVPYGTKSSKEVVKLVDNAIGFMAAQGCKAVVLACNTATAAAAKIMREKYEIPIIGIEPAVKPAVAKSCGKRVLVAATPLTVKEKKLKDLVERVDDEHLVDLVALPKLVEFAERGEFASSEVEEYIKEALSGYNLEKYGEFVLGCTHFNYFKDTFKKVLPDYADMIDGSEGTIRQLERVLAARGELAEADNEKREVHVIYFKSGREITDKTELEYMEKLRERLEKMHTNLFWDNEAKKNL